MKREIIQTTQFKRDYKKIARSGCFSKEEFLMVIDLLAHDKGLQPKFRGNETKGSNLDITFLSLIKPVRMP